MATMTIQPSPPPPPISGPPPAFFSGSSSANNSPAPSSLTPTTTTNTNTIQPISNPSSGRPSSSLPGRQTVQRRGRGMAAAQRNNNNSHRTNDRGGGEDASAMTTNNSAAAAPATTGDARGQERSSPQQQAGELLIQGEPSPQRQQPSSPSTTSETPLPPVIEHTSNNNPSLDVRDDDDDDVPELRQSPRPFRPRRLSEAALPASVSVSAEGSGSASLGGGIGGVISGTGTGVAGSGNPSPRSLTPRRARSNSHSPIPWTGDSSQAQTQPTSGIPPSHSQGHSQAQAQPQSRTSRSTRHRHYHHHHSRGPRAVTILDPASGKPVIVYLDEPPPPYISEAGVRDEGEIVLERNEGRAEDADGGERSGDREISGREEEEGGGGGVVEGVRERGARRVESGGSSRDSNSRPRVTTSGLELGFPTTRRGRSNDDGVEGALEGPGDEDEDEEDEEMNLDVREAGEGGDDEGEPRNLAERRRRRQHRRRRRTGTGTIRSAGASDEDDEDDAETRENRMVRARVRSDPSSSGFANIHSLQGGNVAIGERLGRRRHRDGDGEERGSSGLPRSPLGGGAGLRPAPAQHHHHHHPQHRQHRHSSVGLGIPRTSDFLPSGERRSASFSERAPLLGANDRLAPVPSSSPRHLMPHLRNMHLRGGSEPWEVAGHRGSDAAFAPEVVSSSPLVGQSRMEDEEALGSMISTGSSTTGTTNSSSSASKLRRFWASFVSVFPSRSTVHQALRTYFSPLVSAPHYSSFFYLLVLNFPIALVCWLYLFLGTVVGTGLLVTLPLGIVLWWMTLVGGRIAGRIELVSQNSFHPPSSISPFHSSSHPPLRPIFHRPSGERLHGAAATFLIDTDSLEHDDAAIAEEGMRRSTDAMRRSTASYGATSVAGGEGEQPAENLEVGTGEQRRETGAEGSSFVSESVIMFTDPYSYRCLLYFLIPKACIALSFLVIFVVLTAVAGIGTLGLGFPMVLRWARSAGAWQRRVAWEMLR